jgi:hypothetical protein
MITVLTGQSALAPTVPTGWNLEGSQTASEPAMYVYSRTASSEPSSYSWTVNSANNSAVCFCYPGGTLDVLGTFTISASGTSMAITGLTASAAGALIAISVGRASTSNNWTPPSGMTERCDFNSAGAAGDECIEVADQLAQASGATGTITSTFSASAKKGGVLLMIKANTAAALASNMAAVATMTASLSTSIKLAASFAAQASMTAAVTTQIKLAATFAAVATMTADMRVPINLQASAAAQASMTASLTTQIKLNATMNAVASMTASLTTHPYDTSRMLLMFG